MHVGRGCDDPHLKVEVKPPLGEPFWAPDTQSVYMNSVGLSELEPTRDLHFVGSDIRANAQDTNGVNDFLARSMNVATR